MKYNQYFEERDLKCPDCKHNKFQTVTKNKEWKCRFCGHVITK